MALPLTDKVVAQGTSLIVPPTAPFSTDKRSDHPRRCRRGQLGHHHLLGIGAQYLLVDA